MSILETKTGIILYDPNKVKIAVSAEEIMESYETAESIKEMLDNDCWFGTLQRPLDMFKVETYITIDPSLVAFRIKQIWRNKSKIFGNIEIVDTHAGEHLQKVFDMMVFVPRALGHRSNSGCLLITFDARPDVMRAKSEPYVKPESEDTDGISE